MTGAHAALTMPPRESSDVCGTCRSWRSRDYSVCWNCQMAIDEFGMATPVLPVTLYEKPSELREWVTFYKSSRGDLVAQYAQLLRRTLDQFLEVYEAAIQEDFGPFDYATPVPSAGSAEGAVSGLFGSSSSQLAPLRQSLRFASGALAKPATYDSSWFSVAQDVRGKRIVVVDDVYTSGARAQSAAAALRQNGAEVPLIVVIARRINPDFAPEATAVWQRQAAIGYDLAAPPYWR